MKDKNGHELPPDMYEVKPEHPYGGDSARCHNCKVPLKDLNFTYRTFNNINTFEGERIQGPLCPNCSEMPPDSLPSRKYMEDWW